MEHIKTVIVGGGPAGSAAGIVLRRHDEECCIIDKHAFPREKTCAALLSGKSMGVLSEIMPGEELSGFYLHRNTVAHVCDRARFLVRGEYRESYLTERILFDNKLIEHYKSLGGTLYENERVLDIDRDNKVVKTSLRDIGYDFLICADGADGISRKIFERDNQRLFCVEADISSDISGFSDKVLTIDLGMLEKGYFWIFPKGGYHTIGFSAPHKPGTTYKADFSTYLEYYGIDMNKVKSLRSSFLPCDRINGRIAYRRGAVMLTGDAAGMVDSLSGEGIYYALKSGQSAAMAISSANGRDSLKLYRSHCKEIITAVNRSNRYFRIYVANRQIILRKIKKINISEFVNDLLYNPKAYSIRRMIKLYLKSSK